MISPGLLQQTSRARNPKLIRRRDGSPPLRADARRGDRGESGTLMALAILRRVGRPLRIRPHRDRSHLADIARCERRRLCWPISSGRSGHATRGVFRPRALYAMVHSAKYGNAPMPHSIFFYGQYAIHGTTAVGSLGHASHGCVRFRRSTPQPCDGPAQGAAIRIVGAPETDVAHRGQEFSAACAPSINDASPAPKFVRGVSRFRSV